MIVPDVNLLVYAVNRDAPEHRRAKAWLEKAISGPDTMGFSWKVLLAFLRLSSRSGLLRNPLSPEATLDLIRTWLEQPSAKVVNPGQNHRLILREFFSATGTAGNLTADAHLAAIAIEHGAELRSSGNDFCRFPPLIWRNPLAGFYRRPRRWNAGWPGRIRTFIPGSKGPCPAIGRPASNVFSYDSMPPNPDMLYPVREPPGILVRHKQSAVARTLGRP